MIASLALFGPSAWILAAASQDTGSRGAGTEDLGPVLQERVEGCVVCQRMATDILPGQFNADAHEFACAECHHPHTRRTDDEWTETCTSSGCHPRAWTRSIFHRLDPEIFLDCQNCHAPHVWTVDGQDCRSCHGDLVESTASVSTPNLSGWSGFRHDQHGHLDCGLCHRSEREHATLTMTSFQTCMDCHHGPDVGVDCASCHDAAPAGTFQVPVVFAMDVVEEIEARDLPFRHDLHAAFACQTCHAGTDYRAQTDCRGCHDDHHRLDATCTTCHEPAAADAHPLEVHEDRSCGGAGCHAGEHVFDPLPSQRNLCLVCHQEQMDHQVGKNCADCHLLPPLEAER